MIPRFRSGSALDWRPFVVPGILIVLWEVAMLLGPASASESVAAPHSVLVGFVGMVLDGSLIAATAQTLGSALAGFAIAATIGLVMGLLLGLLPAVDNCMELTIEAIRPIPSVALIPIVLMLLGFGFRMEIVIVAFAALWPVLILTRSAVRGLEPRLLDVARAMRMPFLDVVFKIMIPAIAPRIFVALRLATGVALVVAITVEIAANPIGLGAAMMLAQQTFHPEATIAILFWIGLIGYGLNHVLLMVQEGLFGQNVQREAQNAAF
jgi:NitT/TauT family transport system permease protein